MKEVFVLVQEQLITSHVKGHHLTQIERGRIAGLLSAGKSARQIAAEIGVCHQTINNELKRGRIQQVKKLNGKEQYFSVYAPDTAQVRYQTNRQRCHRPLKFKFVTNFLAYFDDHFHQDDWSPDAAVGFAHQQHLFKRTEMVCTKTLYNYIDAQLLEIRNLDLVEKANRRTKHHWSNKHRRLAGKSIEERPKRVDKRKEFGHFEIDTVVGKRSGNESVLLTFTERKTRYDIVRLIEGKDADSVSYALKGICAEFGDLIKSVTADNGTEFTALNAVLDGVADIYYAHPYSSFERATNETHNRMIRRYLPKGHSLDTIGPKTVSMVESRLNQLPRRILKYQTPKEAFQIEAARIRKSCSA